MRKHRNLFLGAVMSFAVFLVLPACSSDSEEAPPPSSSSGGGGRSEAEVEMCMELCRNDMACKEECQQ